MSLYVAVDAVNPSDPPVADGDSIKLPKNCKENRYYYRNKEKILERRHQKRMEDPAYREKYEEKQRKKAEREEKEKEAHEKRTLKMKLVEQHLNPMAILSGVNETE